MICWYDAACSGSRVLLIHKNRSVCWWILMWTWGPDRVLMPYSSMALCSERYLDNLLIWAVLSVFHSSIYLAITLDHVLMPYGSMMLCSERSASHLRTGNWFHCQLLHVMSTRCLFHSSCYLVVKLHNSPNSSLQYPGIDMHYAFLKDIIFCVLVLMHLVHSC